MAESGVWRNTWGRKGVMVEIGCCGDCWGKGSQSTPQFTENGLVRAWDFQPALPSSFLAAVYPLASDALDSQESSRTRMRPSPRKTSTS